MTVEDYDNLKQYVGSKNDFTDDLLNMGYSKGRADERAKVLGEVKTRIERGLEYSSLSPSTKAHFKVFLSNIFQELKEQSN